MHYPFCVGGWSRAASTNPEAQIWFDRGLNWLYGYNHEEAVACFRRVIEHDEQCALAWWGVAYAAGPFYNRPWKYFSDAEIDDVLPICFEATQTALTLLDACDEADAALVSAIATRYQDAYTLCRDTLHGWHVEYTNVMRTVYKRFPEDLDIATLFVEAAVTCTPRQLWDMRSGTPRDDALTIEAVAVLDRSLAQMQRDEVMHPGIPHMHIHALEMSPFPERSLQSADMLCGYSRDVGHLEHMPAHIYVICGDYALAVEQSRRSVDADDRYVAFAGANNFYTTARCHDLHLYMYAAMFLGQFKTALHAADCIRNHVPDSLIESSAPYMAGLLDGYVAMRTHVFVRFGKWQELVDEPAPGRPDLTPVCDAMHAYGRAVAFANLGRFSDAEQARDVFDNKVGELPGGLVFLNNFAVDMLAVGKAMLEGELAWHQGRYDEAYAYLRTAVERDDNLNYTEPWAWMHPPRHALGALLAARGHFDEAEVVYREDLGYPGVGNSPVPRCCSHPDNVWGLTGLLECVERSGDPHEAMLLRQRLDIARARADVAIRSSCYCRSA